MSKARTVVVGAGAGGLAAAIDLARAGLDVTVLERTEAPGGKIRQLKVDGAFVDVGPTVFTMKWVFEELFADAGADFSQRVTVRPARILARHAWNASERLDLFADPEEAADAIGAFAGAANARGFHAFRRRARDVYQTLEKSFIRAQRPTPLGLIRRAGGLGQLWKINPFQTLWPELKGFFPDPRLQQLFARYATYCGSSAFLAPATLMLVAHVEMSGVWLVEGGMRRIPEQMALLATGLGVNFRYGVKVTDVAVERGRTAAVVLADGERLEADNVVLNADAAAVASGQLGAAAAGAVERVPVGARSLSALTFAVHARASGFPLLRHNVFFGGGAEAELDDIFERQRLPQSPTVYVCAQDRAAEDGPEPGGPERLFCIVNAPPTGDLKPLPETDLELCAQRGFDLLNRCGLQVARTPANVRTTTPLDFERRFPGTGGALYGRATHGAFATFHRPASRTKIPGLYLAGGSTHPGPGVPMAALSGRLAAASLLQDRSTFPARSRPAATPGGTPTP